MIEEIPNFPEKLKIYLKTEPSSMISLLCTELIENTKKPWNALRRETMKIGLSEKNILNFLINLQKRVRDVINLLL